MNKPSRVKSSPLCFLCPHLCIGLSPLFSELVNSLFSITRIFFYLMLFNYLFLFTLLSSLSYICTQRIYDICQIGLQIGQRTDFVFKQIFHYETTTRYTIRFIVEILRFYKLFREAVKINFAEMFSKLLSLTDIAPVS